MEETPRIERALEKYAVILPYLAYENTTFWTRSGFFLVGHAALLAFVATAGLPVETDATEKFATSLVVGTVGLILGAAWLFSIAAGKYWIERWHSVLLKLERDAFGDLEVLRGYVWPDDRNAPKRKGALWAHLSGKYVVTFVAVIFTLLWVSYLGWCATQM
jgi:hypothetical protein